MENSQKIRQTFLTFRTLVYGISITINYYPRQNQSINQLKQGSLWEINVKSKFSDFNKYWFPGVIFDADQHDDHKKRVKPPLDLFRGDFHP
jgi:hypothetical protein